MGLADQFKDKMGQLQHKGKEKSSGEKSSDDRGQQVREKGEEMKDKAQDRAQEWQEKRDKGNQ
ncbi:hypothetical protein ABZ820_35630 [Streptomyces diacarni]|uniref:Uncharacterized protein n=2 Tax=Streptomyces TaxID=1883 RepID=A0A367EKU0_9ACTN|nr:MULTISPECIES: hypothetical protein [Streptomyces]RCG17810.1 hypothetical protein DTL70_26445 [Streptomyces diacarni]UNS97474.1 hypothetical protein MMF93_13960 [Streptomyces tubbatahanensis]